MLHTLRLASILDMSGLELSHRPEDAYMKLPKTRSDTAIEPDKFFLVLLCHTNATEEGPLLLLVNTRDLLLHGAGYTRSAASPLQYVIHSLECIRDTNRHRSCSRFVNIFSEGIHDACEIRREFLVVLTALGGLLKRRVSIVNYTVRSQHQHALRKCLETV
jgi:hypothetical protein